MIKNEYIAKLLSIVADHPAAPCAPALKALIGALYANQKTLTQLHAEINTELTRKGARGTRWSRWTRHTHRHHEELKLALIRAMTEEFTLFTNQGHAQAPVPPQASAQAALSIPPVIEEPISTPVQFNRELFLAHASYTSDDGIIMSNRAMVDLIDNYMKHFSFYSKASTENEKKYHRARLYVLQEWTTQRGYQSLIKAINDSASILAGENTPKNSSIILSEIDQDSLETRQILNWLGNVGENFLGSESAYAMSDALKIIALPLQSESEIKVLAQELDQYIEFYIGSNSITEINIDAKSRVDLLTNMFRLHKVKTNKDHALPENRQILNAIRENLLVIYNELANFFLRQSQLRDQYDRLNSGFDENTSERFYSYFDDALNLRALAIESKNKKQTNQSYEPLEAYVTKGVYFTPHDWKLVEGDPEKESKRLSNRSNSSRKSSTTAHSDRSERSESFERISHKAGDSSPSFRSFLSIKQRSRSVQSLSESSVNENSEQAAATLDENNESLKLKSKRLQLTDKSRNPTQ